MKDPAFLFYSQDFIVGTLAMSFEDRGKYITILCMMHQTGRLSEETISLLVGSVSVNLKSKFSIDENGFYFNERLEKEIEKRKKFTESRVNNGKMGGRPKDKKKPKKNLSVKGRLTYEEPTEKLIENENIYKYSINSIEYKYIIKDIGLFENYKTLYEEFIKWIDTNCPRVNLMDSPIKFEEFIRLKNEKLLDKNGAEKLMEMHNYKDLLKKVSANHTLRTWLNKDKKR
jgi:uncharacterized protein YdaU (DUF1376 family)